MTPEPVDNQDDCWAGVDPALQQFILTASPAERIRLMCLIVMDELDAGGDPSLCVAWLYRFSESYFAPLVERFETGAPLN